MVSDQHILIVDDKRENLLTLERVLRDVEAHVTSAENGNEALAATLNQEFALAILDVQMPDMDGFELAELLRNEKRTRHLPIIFVSAVHMDEFHVFRGYEAGAVDFLTKPFEPAILLNKVRFFLLLDGQRKSLKEKLELEQSKNYLESILTSMTDSVVVVADDFSIKTTNRAAQSMLGYSEDELSGAQLADLFPEHTLPPELSGETNSVLKHTLHLDDVCLLTRDGTRVPVLLNVSDLRSQDDDAKGFVLVAIDNTERKREEERRLALEEQLRHSQRLESMGRLAGGVAHDFNNLLTIILTCSTFLAEKASNDDVMQADVSDIIDAARRGESLARQLLAFGHKQVLRPAVLNLNEIVRSTARILDRTLGSDVLVDLRLEPNLGDIYADSGQLSQVIMNLAINARDAMPSGGTLTISTSSVESDTATTALVAQAEGTSEHDRVRLTVKDTGCGISEELAARVFEPFVTTKKQGEGTGLGLSVVHGIVEQSGGQITLVSVPGDGAVFVIEFPVTTKRRAGASQPSEEEPVSEGGTILIVDDDKNIRQLAMRILERQQFEVFEACTLSEATQIARDLPHLNVLLTDVIMPNNSGPDIAEALMVEHPDLNVVFMSGYGDGVFEFQEFPSERTFFLQKPFTPNTLVEMLRSVLQKR